MTAAEMLPLLQAWADRHAALSKRMGELAALVGTHDGPLGHAVWDAWRGYTVMLAHRVGDQRDWLDWYCEENDMGRKRLEVQIGQRRFKVRTLAQLARAIEGSRT